MGSDLFMNSRGDLGDNGVTLGRRAAKQKQRFDPETGDSLIRLGKGQDYYGYFVNPRTGDRFYYSKERDPATDEPFLKKVKTPMSLAERRRRTIKPKHGDLAEARKRLIQQYRSKLAKRLDQFWRELERDLARLDR
jgi:hypothetical protein